MDKNNVRAKQHPSYGTFTALGLLLPIIGIIIGIVYLTKKDLLDRKVGEHTIVMSIIGFVLTFVIIGIMGSSSSDKSSTTPKQQTTTPVKTLTPEEQEKKLKKKPRQRQKRKPKQKLRMYQPSINLHLAKLGHMPTQCTCQSRVFTTNLFQNMAVSFQQKPHSMR